MNHNDSLDGWIITDPDTNQAYKEIEKDVIYLFREDRINPITKGKELFIKEINIEKYYFDTIEDALKTFAIKWEDATPALIAECLFELSN